MKWLVEAFYQFLQCSILMTLYPFRSTVLGSCKKVSVDYSGLLPPVLKGAKRSTLSVTMTLIAEQHYKSVLNREDSGVLTLGSPHRPREPHTRTYILCITFLAQHLTDSLGPLQKSSLEKQVQEIPVGSLKPAPTLPYLQ